MTLAVFFAVLGFVTKSPDAAPIPPLEQRDLGPSAIVGEIVALEGGHVTLVTEQGQRHELTLAGDVTVELLERIALADIAVGDWLNGGAIAHAQTVLALVNLILISEPVTP